jgi:hypothetical protein
LFLVNLKFIINHTKNTNDIQINQYKSLPLIIIPNVFCIIAVFMVIILTKIINLIKPQNNFKKKLKIFGNIKNKSIFVIQ